VERHAVSRPSDDAPMSAAERRAQRADARRCLRELRATRAALLAEAGDSMVRTDLAAVESRIRAAERLLREDVAS